MSNYVFCLLLRKSYAIRILSQSESEAFAQTFYQCWREAIKVEIGKESAVPVSLPRV